jgi:hypothetical protein
MTNTAQTNAARKKGQIQIGNIVSAINSKGESFYGEVIDIRQSYYCTLADVRCFGANSGWVKVADVRDCVVQGHAA